MIVGHRVFYKSPTIRSTKDKRRNYRIRRICLSFNVLQNCVMYVCIQGVSHRGRQKMITHSVRRLFFFFIVGMFCQYSPTDKQKKEEKAKEASYKTYISLRQQCAKVRRLHVRLQCVSQRRREKMIAYSVRRLFFSFLLSASFVGTL